HQGGDVRPVEVEHQQRRGVAADGHERPVAQGDLATEPGQHGEPGHRRDLDRHLGDLEVAEGAQPDGQEPDDHRRDDGDTEPARQRLHAHTRRTLVAPSRPASAQPTVSTRATRMPDSRAIVALNAAARIRSPAEVYRNARASASVATSTAAATKMSKRDTPSGVPPTLSPVTENAAGNDR